jgi:hypothetical protein
VRNGIEALDIFSLDVFCIDFLLGALIMMIFRSLSLEIESISHRDFVAAKT